MAEQEPLRKLYDVLSTEQLYTKSFDEFKTKYSTEEEVSKMFNVISERQLYTKDLNSFKSQYFPNLGKQTEVSGQGSVGTSQTSGQQSSSSAEPSSDVSEMGSGVSPYTAQADLDTLLSSDPTRQVRGNVNLQGERGISYVDPTDGNVYNYLPTTEVTATVPFRQQLSNVFHNAKQQLAGFDDRLSLVAADTWEKILGKELAAGFYGISDRNIEEVRAEAYAQLQALDESMKFVAPIGGSIAEGDLLGAMAGIINAATSMGTTALVALPTAGVGLYTEMVGQGLYDYNTTKAQELGLTVEELYAQGKADYALPATVGIVGGALEKAGFKGVTKAFMTALNSPVGKVIARTAIESNKEGLTEWFQEGLSALNTEMAKEGATFEDGVRAMGQALASEQGLEAYLGGVFGGLSAAGVGSTVRSINRKVTDVNKKKKIEKTAKAIAALNEELSNTNLNPTTREVLEQNRESLQGEVLQDIKEASVEYESLSPEQKSEIESLENRREELETAISDPNVSEDIKATLQAQVEELDTQITEVALPGDRPTPIEGETFELSRLPEALNTPDSLEQIEADSRRLGEEFADGTIDEATWTLANEQIGRREVILNQSAQEQTPVSGTTSEGVEQNLNEIATVSDSRIENTEQISQELSTPTFFETVTDSESREVRIEQLKQSLSDSLKADQNLGIFQDNRDRAKRDIDFLRDLTELAILSIADGTVQTADAFRNLAKGIGDFGDNVLNRAYTAATQSVEEYQTWARPKEATDARVGELLTRMQDVTVDRSPAKTKVRARQVKELTDGGIKGRVNLTNRQALREQIKTLNRGIRDGKKQIVESREAITTFIKDMKEQGLFKGKVRGSTVQALLNRVNKANTPAALSNALTYAEKASEIIGYDQQRAKAENNKKKLKRASKGRGMPQDLKAVMTDIANINLTYVDNIEQFNDMTDRLLDAVKGMGIDGIWTEDFVKLKEFVDKKIKQAKENRLRDELVNAGMDQDFVDGLNTLDQLMEALATLPEGSKARSSESLRSIRERALEQTLPMIEEMDRTGFTDKQNAVIDALLGLDVSKISDSILPSVVIAAKNIAVNGSFLGTGPIEVEYKFQQRTNDTKNVNTIKKNVASVNKFIADIRGKIGTVLIQIDSILKNRDAVGAFMEMTGFGDYIAKYNIFVNRFNTEVRDELAEVQRKYRKDLRDPLQRMILGAYADLNNSKKSWDDSERAKEFAARKEAIKESYKRMVEFAKLTPRGWGRDNKNYIELYGKLVDQLDSFNSVEDIWNSLNKGHQELYNVARKFYDRMIPEVKQNAEIDNNTIFENEWQGTYFPRSYMPLDTKVRRQEQINATQTSILDQLAEGNTFNATSTHVTGTEVSGAKRARTLTGSELPLNTHIDLDFMTNFLQESKKMLYDVETQAERQYSARVMHSPELLEIFGDVDALDIFRNAMIQKMEKDLMATNSRGVKSAIRSISDEVYGMNVNLALGGMEQIVKQAVPQLVDTEVRLGKNGGLLFTGMHMYVTGEFEHLMEGSSVRHRNVRNVEVRDNTLSQKEISYIKKIVDSQLGRLGKKGKEIRDLVTMGPLTLGDDFAAKSSWYAHYVDYLKRNDLLKFTPDGKMDLSEVNKDARAYADFQTDLSNNISDPAMKAKLFSGTTGSVVRAVYPFISFAVNAKNELINNLSRLMEGDSHTVDQKMAIGRAIGANITNIFIYGMIGEAIRDQMVKISGAVIADLVANSGDLDEEELEKLQNILEERTSELREANKRNSKEYLIKDLLFGGIAEQFTEPFYDLSTKLYYSTKGDQKALEELNKRGKSSDPWDLAFEAMGGYGLLPRTGRRFYTSFREWHLTDAEWRARKYGIEDEMGEALVVPIDKEGVERPNFARDAHGLSTIAHGIALFTGASWQSISGTVQRVQRLAKMAEQELHGRDVGKLKEIESLKTITVGSEKVELTEEQFERAKEIRKAVVRKIMLAEVNPVLDVLKEETGLDVPEITKNEIGVQAGERVAIETIREIATDFAKAAIILEDNLLEGVQEKERAKVEKKLRSQHEAVEAYVKALNLGKLSPEEYEQRRIKK